MIAIDTNLLVYAHRSHVPQHKKSKEAIERACREAGGLGTTFPNIVEFWSIVTHPTSSGRPSTEREANLFLQALKEDGNMATWIPGVDFPSRFLRRAAELRITGVRIFDLQIALIAQENGATKIWTHDEHFTRVPGLAVYDPL